MAARSFIQQAAKQLLHFLPCFSGTSCSRKQEIWEHFSMLAHVWGEDVTEHSFMSSSRECVCWENLCEGIWGWKVEEDEFTLQRSLSLVFSRADFTPGELSWSRHCRSIQRSWVPGTGQGFQTEPAAQSTCCYSPSTFTPDTQRVPLGSLLLSFGGFRSGRDDLEIFHRTQHTWGVVWAGSCSRSASTRTVLCVEDPPKHHSPLYSFSATVQGCENVWHQHFCPLIKSCAVNFTSSCQLFVEDVKKVSPS